MEVLGVHFGLLPCASRPSLVLLHVRGVTLNLFVSDACNNKQILALLDLCLLRLRKARTSEAARSLIR
jgi:hypothetical protein